MALTVDWRNPVYSAPVAEALINVLDQVRAEDIDDNTRLAEAVSSAIVRIDLLKYEPELVPETASNGEPTIPISPTTPTSPTITIPDNIPDTSEQTAYSVVTSKAHTLRDLDQLYEQAQVKITKEEKPDNIANLIKDLEVDDLETRRLARSKLASVGQEATSDLMVALKSKNEIYRIRLGVITALLLMNEPVLIEAQNISLITDLLGDGDSTIRKNTARFLIRFMLLHSQEPIPESDRIIEKTLKSLSNNLSQVKNPNLVYNSAVVLGEFLNVAPQTFSKRKLIREILESAKDNLKKNPRSWKRTIMQIDNSLK